MNTQLRKTVKVTKALKGKSYTWFAKQIGITQSSIYAWLKGQYELSDRKEAVLEQVLQSLQED